MLMKTDEFQPAPPTVGSTVSKYFRRLLALVLVAGLVGVVGYAIWMPEQAQQALTGRGKDGQGKRKGGGAAGERVPVLAAPLKRSDVPVILDGVGTARALQSVTIRPQVDGKIMHIAFREGQDIKAGDLIAEIDPAVYKAQVDQLVAKRALTQTQLNNAKLDIERYLKIPGVIPQKTVDTQRALVEQLEAQVKADTAAINSAEAQLGYTRITAPISGRAGMRLVDEGNLVRSGEAGIVVITQVQPISILFTLPQQQLAQVTRALARGPVPVEALDGDGRRVIDTGELKVIDNQVDQTTGTVKMKADFPNASFQLWPGQFANIRVRVDVQKDVIAIPVAAVQRGPTGTYVYVVGEDGRAEMRNVTLGLVTETEAVVTQGLEPKGQVITSGFVRLTAGSPVEVQATGTAGPAGATGVPDGQAGGAADGKGQGKGEGRRKRGEGAAAGATGGEGAPTGDRPRGKRGERGGAAAGAAGATQDGAAAAAPPPAAVQGEAAAATEVPPVRPAKRGPRP